MTPEIGHFALVAALLFSLTQVIAPLWGLYRQQPTLLALTAPAQIAACIAVLVAFISLIWAFITSDFSFDLVVQYSHSQKPLIYKIAGTWGNHEGSLLLWVLILVSFGTLFCLTAHRLDTALFGLILAVQGMISSAFLAFSLLTSNPFRRLETPPIEGLGLNPVLQDIGLALHPPTLYLGYVGLSIAFAFAVAGLIQGRIDQRWARALRPWVTAAWSALTAGITLGSWWAYYELGWGGWWFWDPVENVSLMPWLIATALLHSVRVVEVRGQFKSWTVLLAIMGFSLSLLGTFIVRSGLLTSVHSFAADPTRGIFILAILLLAVGLPLVLYAWRGPRLVTVGDFSFNSREMALIVNNGILVIATAIVLLGTFYPLGLEMFNGARITVGPPYFDATFNPIMAVGLLGMGIAGTLAWGHGGLPHAKKTLLGALLMGLVCIFVGLGFGISIAALAGLGVLGWLASGIVIDIALRVKPWQKAAGARLMRLGLPIWGMWLAHFGTAVFLAGVLGENLLQTEAIVRAQPAQEVNLGDDTVVFKGSRQTQGPNYQSLSAELQLYDAEGQEIALLYPERRFYPAENQTTTEAAIHTTWLGDYYAVLGDGDPQRGYTLRLYHKPVVAWIWGGAGLMVLGGLVSLVSRHRIPKA